MRILPEKEVKKMGPDAIFERNFQEIDPSCGICQTGSSITEKKLLLLYILYLHFTPLFILRFDSLVWNFSRKFVLKEETVILNILKTYFCSLSLF